MKQLVCDMCASTDLIKQDGMFVCQSCGCKYSIEEAKKMMVEGTVKIDNSEKLNNYYTLARQAKESNDAENAVKYYDLIKQEDPNSWEACFYNVYFRAIQTRVINIESAANSIKNCLGTVFKLIKNSSDSVEVKKPYVWEVVLRVVQICFIFEASARSTLTDLEKDNTSPNLENFVDYSHRSLSCAYAILECGDLIEQDYMTDSEMIETACTTWEQGIMLWKNSYALYDDHAERYSSMKNSYVAKLQKYKGDYSFTAPQYQGLPSIYKKIVSVHSDSDFGTSYSSINTSSSTSDATSSSKSGGCYVATAVYGSYDCPQVWTLRRYRDNTLAETWYGRAFIRTYYAVSPTVVKLLGNTDWFKKMWKGKLDRMVADLQSKGVESTPYDDLPW